MKKIKLLPSIIMLALCLAVLGIGVYSATTGSNTISGTLTVNSAGYEVEISVYKNAVADGNKIATTTTSRAGREISLDPLVFNSNEANYLGDVDLIDVIIEVTNKSNDPVGIYFWDGTGDYSHGVTESFISGNHVVYGHKSIDGTKYGGGTAEDIIDAEYSFYHCIPAKSGNTTYTEYMHVYLRLNELNTVSVSASLSLKLNVEKYVANFTSVDLNSENEVNDYPETTFVKMACLGMTNAVTEFNFSTNFMDVTHAVLPYGLTTAGGTWEYATSPVVALPTTIRTFTQYMSYLESLILPIGIETVSLDNIFDLSTIFIPSSVTSLTLSNCSDLKSVNITGGITTMTSDMFYMCYSLETVIIPSSVQEIDGSFFENPLTYARFASDNLDWWIGGSPRTKITGNLADPAVAASLLKTTVTWYNSAS